MTNKYVGLFLLACAVSVTAQSKPPVPSNPTRPAPAPALPSKSPIDLSQSGKPNQPALPGGQLTELEDTKLQLEGTQNLLLRKEEQELQVKHQQTIQAINRAHPGFLYNQQTGTLVPVPAQPKTEEVKPTDEELLKKK